MNEALQSSRLLAKPHTSVLICLLAACQTPSLLFLSLPTSHCLPSHSIVPPLCNSALPCLSLPPSISISILWVSSCDPHFYFVPLRTLQMSFYQVFTLLLFTVHEKCGEWWRWKPVHGKRLYDVNTDTSYSSRTHVWLPCASYLSKNTNGKMHTFVFSSNYFSIIISYSYELLICIIYSMYITIWLCSFCTPDNYCTPLHPGRGLPPQLLSLRVWESKDTGYVVLIVKLYEASLGFVVVVYTNRIQYISLEYITHVCGL